VELSKLDSKVGIALAKLFDQLKIGLSTQRELMVFIAEIALRENIHIESLLEEKALSSILDDDELDCTQKRRKIREYLKQRRFPAIITAKKEFERHVKNIKLGNRIRLTPPRDFEGSNYTLSLSFADLSELKQLQGRLDRIIESTGLQKFFSKKPT
jgi:hypothetical protein